MTSIFVLSLGENDQEIARNDQIRFNKSAFWVVCFKFYELADFEIKIVI